jgi:bacteriocin biosynthesis cyclodehydratase domain-containing protein
VDPVQSPRLLILAVDEFGAEVARRLTVSYPRSEVQNASRGSHPSLWPAADVLVLASGHDRPVLAEMLDRSAFAWRRPWFPVLMQNMELRCGPVVVPGHTACHRCFRRRRLQHAPDPAAVDDPFFASPTAAPPAAGPMVTGYADHHVGIAVGLARQAVGDALTPDDELPSGWVRTLSLVDGGLARSGVVPVDRCGRCSRSRDPEFRWRRFMSLVDDVAVAG